MENDALSADVAAARFAALGSGQRLAVLRALVRAGPDGLTIGTLGARAGVTGSTLTHHLKILAQAGLVTQTRTGRSIVCVVDYDEVRALSTFLLTECCADTADRQDPRSWLTSPRSPRGAFRAPARPGSPRG